MNPAASIASDHPHFLGAQILGRYSSSNAASAETLAVWADDPAIQSLLQIPLSISLFHHFKSDKIVSLKVIMPASEVDTVQLPHMLSNISAVFVTIQMCSCACLSSASYFCITTNLSQAEPSVHQRGLLWKLVRASMTIVGLVPPVYYKGDLLVDGG